jgi:hypothetical protein
VILIARGGAEAAPGELAAGEGDHPQLELGAPRSVRAAVAAPGDEQPAPAVALVARHAGADARPQFAREFARELAGRVQALLRAGVQALRADPLEQLPGRVGGQRGRAQVALQGAAERGDQPDRVQRQDGHQLPAVGGPERGRGEHADRPVDALDRRQPGVGEREPGGGGDPPAAQIAGGERVGVRQHPARELVGLLFGDPEAVCERAPLVVERCPHARVVEVDRQPGVRPAKRLVEPRRGRGDRRPVQPGLAVEACLAVDQRAHGAERQPPRVHAAQPVAAQHRLRVLVAAVPRVGVVGVNRIVGGEPPQRGDAEVFERGAPAREAALELAAGVGVAGAARAVVPFGLLAGDERAARTGQLERAGRRRADGDSIAARMCVVVHKRLLRSLKRPSVQRDRGWCERARQAPQLRVGLEGFCRRR